MDPLRDEACPDGRDVASPRKRIAVLGLLLAAEGGVVSGEELLNGRGMRTTVRQPFADSYMRPARMPESSRLSMKGDKHRR